MLRGDLQNGIAGPAAAASALPSASTHRRCTSQVPLILPLPGAGDIRIVLYWNNPFDTVRRRRAERHFLSRWLSSGEVQ